MIEHAHPHGFNCRHNLSYYAGGLVEFREDDKGDKVMIDFGDPHIRVKRKKHDCTMYAEYRPWCSVGLGENDPLIALPEERFNITSAEPVGKNGLNVAENLRLVPPGRPTYTRTYGWRNNSETDNRTRDLRKHEARARSHGAERQHWNEILAAMVQNGEVLMRHRDRQAQAGASATAA